MHEVENGSARAGATAYLKILILSKKTLEGQTQEIHFSANQQPIPKFQGKEEKPELPCWVTFARGSGPTLGSGREAASSLCLPAESCSGRAAPHSKSSASSFQVPFFANLRNHKCTVSACGAQNMPPPGRPNG